MENTDLSYHYAIVRYLDGSATKEEEKQLLEWLKENDKNRKTFEDIKNIWVSTMSVFSSDQETEAALDRFKQRIYSYQAEKKTIQKRKMYGWRVAAVIAVVVGLSYFTLQQTFFSKDDTTLSTRFNEINISNGSKGYATLPDGTLVWLNSDSKLIYPAQFSSKERKVRLEGEAYFEVSRNEKQPFIVESDAVEIKVLGTSFNLSGYEGEDKIEATLVSGSVSVKIKGSNTETVLSPNEKLSYSRSARVFFVEKVDAGKYALWASDKLTFDNETLEEVLSKLEHWFKIKVDCPKELAQKVRVTFTLKGETKEQTFKALSEVTPIRYRIKGEHVVIYAK